MRLLWAVVVTVIGVSVSVPTSYVYAELRTRRYDMVQIHEKGPARRPAQTSSDIVPNTLPPRKTTDRQASRIRDLFPKDIYEKLGTKAKDDSLHFEPWMPGRGAVGVRVEVTW